MNRTRTNMNLYAMKGLCITMFNDAPECADPDSIIVKATGTFKDPVDAELSYGDNCIVVLEYLPSIMTVLLKSVDINNDGYIIHKIQAKTICHYINNWCRIHNVNFVTSVETEDWLR